MTRLSSLVSPRRSVTLAAVFAIGGMASFALPGGEAQAQTGQPSVHPFDEPIVLTGECPPGQSCLSTVPYKQGVHQGYVSTKGIVLEPVNPDDIGIPGIERFPVWAEYLLDGSVKRIRVAETNSEYEGAHVVTKEEVGYGMAAYAELAQKPDVELMTARNYLNAEFQTVDGSPIDPRLKRTLRRNTTHVLAYGVNRVPDPSTAPLVYEFPFDPTAIDSEQHAAGENGTGTVLIQAPRGGDPGGRVLYASSGVIDYLTDYFSETKSNQFGFCSPRDLDESLLWRFERCDPHLVGDIWGALVGAGVDVGARWMFGDTQVYTSPGTAQTRPGWFVLPYPYPQGWEGFDTLYVKLRAARHDPRAKFGNLWIERKQVQAGATFEYNESAVIDPQFQGALSGNVSWQAVAEREGLIVDTQKPRSVNVGIDLAYVVATAQLVNEERFAEGVGLPEHVRTGYAQSEEQAGDGVSESVAYQHQITINDHPEGGEDANVTLYDDSAPAIEPTGFHRSYGLQRFDDLKADLVDRGLLRKISRADLANTDVYLFVAGAPAGDWAETENPNVRLGSFSFERRGLLANETEGMVKNDQGEWWLPDDRTYLAAFHPQFFTRHLGQVRLKMVVINRSTGYMGTRLLRLAGERLGTTLNECGDGFGAEPPAGGSDQVFQVGNLKISPIPDENCDTTIYMRPPNLTVKAERVRVDKSDGADNQTVATEGAGLTSDTAIKLTTIWRDWDGTALPAALPGFTGRLSKWVQTSAPGEPVTGELVPAGGNDRSGEATTRVGHFDIEPGEHAEVIHVADPGAGAAHYYLHVSAVPMDRCDEATGHSAAACMNFESSRGGNEGPLSYRPKTYVPIKVPIYDEEATRDALHAAAEQARQQAAQNPASVVQMEAVKPVYEYVYRPEYQFTLWELEEPKDEEVQIVTEWDPNKGSTTGVDFEAPVIGPGYDPLPGWGPDRTLLWGLGYEEYLALLDGKLACAPGTPPEECGVNNLDRLVAYLPSSQAGVVEGIAGSLSPYDYLAIQLYQATDAGNVLYDYQLGYPTIRAEARPLYMKRRIVRSELDDPEEYDNFHVIALEVNEPAQVRVKVFDPGGDELGELFTPQTNLQAGKYYVVVDYESLMNLVPTPSSAGDPGVDPNDDPNFVLEIQGKPLDDLGRSWGGMHRIRFPGYMEAEKVGEPVGQVVVHDVNITDGSLRIGRTDFSIPGAGPELEFTRNYTNLNEDADGLLGPGWSHSLDYRLVVLRASDVGTGRIPSWVAQLKGRFVSASEAEPHIFPANRPVPTKVYVNGTTFTRDGDGEGYADWVSESGRYAALKLLSTPCDGAPPVEQGDPVPGCFVFRAKNGTEYHYPEPIAKSGSPSSTQGSSPFSISLPDGIAMRAGYFNLATDGAALYLRSKRAERFEPTAVRLIQDRFGQKLTFGYDGQGRLATVTDEGRPPSSRTCTFDYDPAAGPADCDAVFEGVRLRRVRCLEGDPSEEISVGFCYDANGYLQKAEQGTRSETYTYEKQATESCDDTSNPYASVLPRSDGTGGAGTGGTGSGEPGTGGTSGGTVEKLPARPQDLGDGFQYSSGGTDGNDASGSKVPNRESVCPHNLTAITDQAGNTLSFEYRQDVTEVDLGLEALRKHPAGEIVIRVTYPPTRDAADAELVASVGIDYGSDRTRTIEAMRSGDPATVYTLNPQGNPATIVEPEGKTTTMVWSGKMLESKTVAGHGSGQASTTTYTYDACGNLTEEAGPEPGIQVSMTWDTQEVSHCYEAFSLPLTRSDWRGISEEWQYDPQGFLVAHRDGAGNWTDYEPDPDFPSRTGRAQLRGDPARAIVYSYDAHGNSFSEQLESVGAASETITVRNARGEVTSRTDPNDHVTLFEYDANGRLTKTILPAGAEPTLSGVHFLDQITIQYLDNENKKVETDRNGLVVTTEFTRRGQVYKVTRSEGGHTRRFGYDAAGNLTYEGDFRGNATRHEYDALGFRTKTTNRAGAEVVFTNVDVFGNVWEVRDANQVVTQFTYDLLNRETSRERLTQDTPHGKVTTTYDQESNQGGAYSVVVKDEDNLTSTTHYDGLNRVVAVVDKAGNVSTTTYDAAGNVIRTRDAEGVCTHYAYDERNRTRFTVASGRNCAQGAPGYVTEFEYDNNGNLTTTRTWPSQSPTYTAANPPSGSAAEWVTVYDSWNRPKSRYVPGVAVPYTTEYDGEGNVVRQVDPLGNEQRWVRNQRGWTLEYHDAVAVAGNVPFENGGQATAKYESYDGNGNVERVVDGRGVVTDATYDAEDRVLTVTEDSQGAFARSTQVLEYDGLGNPRFVRDARGNTTEYVYNDRNLVAEVRRPEGVTELYTYDELGRVKTQQTSPRPYVRAYAYDALGRVEAVCYPASGGCSPGGGNVEFEYDYDKVGNLTVTTNRRGSITENVYDDFHRLTETYREGTGQSRLRVAQYVYDAVGNVTETTDAKGNVTSFVYNGRNLLEQTILPEVGEGGLSERTETRTYDFAGRLQSVSAPTRSTEAARVTTYAYDPAGRVLAVTFSGETTSYTYDILGNLKTTTLPKAQALADGAPAKSEVREYDAHGRVKTIIDQAGNVTTFAYDANDNLVEQQGPVAKVTYTYDTLNRRKTLTQVADGTTLETRFETYDAAGNLEKLTDANGRTFEYQYDHYNRRVSATYPSTGSPFHEPDSIVWQYDDDNNQLTITETKGGAAGSQIDLTVEELDLTWDRLTKRTQRGHETAYEYDANGNRTSVTTEGGTTTYEYDARNRLVHVDTGVERTTYTHYPDGRIDTIAYPNGVTATYDYWPTNRIKSITHTGSPDLVDVAYTYDANGNRETENAVRGLAAEQTTYGYDAADRLSTYTIGGQLTGTYTYEGYNRKTEVVVEDGTVVHNRTYTYDTSNRLTQIDELGADGPYTITYSYDNNGNTLTKEKSNDPSATTTFEYDSRDQLVQVTRGPPGSAQIEGQYDYDAHGLRVRVRAGSRGDIDYYYDGAAVIEERSAADDSLVARYHYADRALRMDDYSGGSAEPLYYHHDALGTTTHLTRPDGSIAQQYKVDPWGRPRSGVAGAGNVLASANRKLFTGHEYDPNTGLYYAKARYYDPDQGRFLTQDAYLGEPGVPPSLHRYLYAASNPARYVDPTGHFFQECEGADCMLSSDELEYQISSGDFPRTGPTGGMIAERAAEAFERRREIREWEVATERSRMTLEDRSGREPVAVGLPYLDRPLTRQEVRDAEWNGVVDGAIDKMVGLAEFTGGALPMGLGMLTGPALGRVTEKALGELRPAPETNARAEYLRERSRGAFHGATTAVELGSGMVVGPGATLALGRLSGAARTADDLIEVANLGRTMTSGARATRAPPVTSNAALRPGVVLEDGWAGSVGAARARSVVVERPVPTPRTILGNEVGAPLVRESTAAGGAAQAPKLLNAVPKSVLNTATHIFGPKSLAKHKLGPVLEAFGGDAVAATYRLQNAAQALANQGAIQGVFRTTVQVAGQNVTVGGRVVDGVVKLGTAFIP